MLKLQQNKRGRLLGLVPGQNCHSAGSRWSAPRLRTMWTLMQLAMMLQTMMQQPQMLHGHWMS